MSHRVGPYRWVCVAEKLSVDDVGEASFETAQAFSVALGAVRFIGSRPAPGVSQLIWLIAMVWMQQLSWRSLALESL